MNNQVLIIAGMHRSGTSLTAQWLYLCGLHIGNNLMGEGIGNIHGHYEDLDFFEIHKKILQSNNLPISGLCDIGHLEINDEHVKKINDLLNRKNAQNECWGWKEPRTTLFLNLYEELLSSKVKYLIVYRGIEEVVDSLLRRKIKMELLKRKKAGRKERLFSILFRAKIVKNIIKQYQLDYINAWISYNEKIIEHALSIEKSRIFITSYNNLLINADNVFEWLEYNSLILKRKPFKEVYDGNLINKKKVSLYIPENLIERVGRIEEFFIKFNK